MVCCRQRRGPRDLRRRPWPCWSRITARPGMADNRSTPGRPEPPTIPVVADHPLRHQHFARSGSPGVPRTRRECCASEPRPDSGHSRSGDTGTSRRGSPWLPRWAGRTGPVLTPLCAPWTTRRRTSPRRSRPCCAGRGRSEQRHPPVPSPGNVLTGAARREGSLPDVAAMLAVSHQLVTPRITGLLQATAGGVLPLPPPWASACPPMRRRPMRRSRTRGRPGACPGP